MMSFSSNIKNIRIDLLFGFVVAGFSLMVLPVHAATFSKPHSNLGLVAHWSFDEGTSTIAHDFSGFDENGTLTNMDANTDWVAGKRGKALDFDGSNDYLANTDASLLGEFTVSFWWNTSSSNSDVRCVFGHSAGSIKICKGVTTNKFFFRVLTSGSSDNTVDLPSSNVWHHITLTRDSSNKVDLFVDGGVPTRLFSNAAQSGIFAISNIGRSDAGTGQYWLGYLDDIRIYNRKLSQDEINAFSSTGQTIRTGVSDRGIVGYWSFDEGTSTIAHDFSGNGNDGALENMESGDWINGKRGKALSFDNAGDERISVGNSPSVQLTVGTMSAWIKTSNAGSSYRGIIAKQMAYGMFLNNNSFSIYDWGANAERSSGKILNDNQWHHVACSFQSGVSNGTLCYADGVLILTTTMTVSNQNAPLYIAEANATQFFNGQIDNVHLYSRVLSPTEIRALYQQNKTLINAPQKDQLTNGLVGYWSFNAPDMHWPTNVAYDRSGRGNNGSILNMSTSSSPVSGASGQALNFDSINDHILVPNSTSLNITSSITISAWIKPNSFGQNNFGRIVHKDGVNGYIFSLNNNSITNGLLFYSGGVNASTSNVITLNRWQHVASVFNGSTVTLYVNGIAVSTQAQPALTASTASLGIGIRPADSLRGFDGIIDEVRIYNRALSDSEMKQLYGMGRK